MRGRLVAYGCYTVGSCVFLVAAVARGSVLVGLGSSFFLAGTLLMAGLELRRPPRAPSTWRC